MGAIETMSSDRSVDETDERRHTVVRMAFLRGLFEGFGGPMLMCTEPNSRRITAWLKKKAANKTIRATTSYDEVFEKVMGRICREVLRAADQTLGRHGLEYIKIVEDRLDDKGELRQEERMEIREMIRSKNGEKKQ